MIVNKKIIMRHSGFMINVYKTIADGFQQCLGSEIPSVDFAQNNRHVASNSFDATTYYVGLVPFNIKFYEVYITE